MKTSPIHKIIDKTFNRIYNRIVLKSNRVQLKDMPRIRGRLCCINSQSGAISIGKNCKFNSANWANPIGGFGQVSIISSFGGKKP